MKAIAAKGLTVAQNYREALADLAECRALLSEMRRMIKDHPDFQGRQFVGVGIRVNAQLNKGGL